ncbi:NUDIX domain-containing protein, partial [Nocardia tengchongensis]|uniref:NUDIX domain-containing protein n=1 Tax=Nocardia tengchongensis TaxID=2055889 RepID=UPI00368E97EC
MAEDEACVQTLLVRDGQVLLMRRQNTGVGDGWWAAPGGCIEAGEDYATAAIRETAEEVGVTIPLADVDLAPGGGGETKGTRPRRRRAREQHKTP